MTDKMKTVAKAPIKMISTGAGKADGLLDFLTVKAPGVLNELLPQKWKTLTGALSMIVGIALWYLGLPAESMDPQAWIGWGLWQDVTWDDKLSAFSMGLGGVLAQLGVVHKNRKADPPGKPDVTPDGSDGTMKDVSK